MNRAKKFNRDLWNLLLCHLPSRRLRRLWLARMLNQTGNNAFVCMGTQFLQPDSIHLGERSVVNAHCILDGRGSSLVIEHDVDIGTHSHIWTLEHDPNDPTHGTRSAPVTIEHHAWLASRVTVLPGVTIGKGAVVSAGSVVTKDVSPLTIVAGVPAKVIGHRNNPLEYQLNFSPRFR